MLTRHRCVFYGDLYPNKECDTSSVASTLRKLMALRKTHAYGPVKDYFHDKNCIGFVRTGENGRGGCAVVISNADPKTQYVFLLVSASYTNSSGKLNHLLFQEVLLHRIRSRCLLAK